MIRINIACLSSLLNAHLLSLPPSSPPSSLFFRYINLALKILSIAARQIQDDWEKRYKYRSVLLETFVETDRFRVTSYKATNWRLVGTTKDRGKLGPAGKQSVQF